jgi:hypothetical protein
MVINVVRPIQNVQDASAYPKPWYYESRALYGWYVILKESGEIRNKENLFKEINQYISDHVGR